MKKLFVIFLMLGFNSSYLFSQPFPSWLNYSFSQRVSDISLTDNFVWVSTQGGLVKYNKTTGEKTYFNRANANLPDNNLLSLFCNTDDDFWVGGINYGIGNFCEKQCRIYNQANSGLPFDQYNSKIQVDKNGNVWVASFRYIARFDGANWKTWETGSDISSWPVVSDFIIDENGIVWLCSTDGLGKIENDMYSVISGIVAGINQCIGIDKNNNIWIGTEQQGLYKYNGLTFTNYNTTNSSLSSNNFYSMTFDSENNIWLASYSGLIKFNVADCKLFKPDSSMADIALITVKAEKNGTIWCGTFSGKLLSFDGDKFTAIELSNSPLMNNYIADVLIDDDNTEWIGTPKNLVKKSDTQFLSIFNRSSTALAKDNTGAVWIAFGAGDTCLLKIGDHGATVFDSINSPFTPGKTSINRMTVDKNNNLWLSSNHGLYKYDGNAFVNYSTDNSTIPSNEVFQVVFDKENNLWGGSANGLFKFNGSEWTVMDTTNSAIPTNIIVGLAFDAENRLWFSCMDTLRKIGGDFGGGLTCFDGQTMTTYNMTNSGLLTNTIWDVFVDKNDVIWLATCGAGLMSFDKVDKWTSYNVTNSGIANNVVQLIRQDKTGNFWLGHIDAGISVFNPDSHILSTNRLAEENKSLSIFPNPVNDDLYINYCSNDNDEIQTRIFDLNGKLIHIFPEQKISNGKTSIHYNLNGILNTRQLYVIQISGKSDQYDSKFLYNGR